MFPFRASQRNTPKLPSFAPQHSGTTQGRRDSHPAAAPQRLFLSDKQVRKTQHWRQCRESQGSGRLLLERCFSLPVKGAEGSSPGGLSEASPKDNSLGEALNRSGIKANRSRQSRKILGGFFFLLLQATCSQWQCHLPHQQGAGLSHALMGSSLFLRLSQWRPGCRVWCLLPPEQTVAWNKSRPTSLCRPSSGPLARRLTTFAGCWDRLLRQPTAEPLQMFN